MWDLMWRSETDLDPRLIRQWAVGPVNAVAWWPGDPGPMLAVGTDEKLGDGEDRYRLLIIDVATGQIRELPSAEAIFAVAFAVTVDGPVLVDTHTGGGLRVWNAVDGSLIRAIPDGGGRDAAVVEVDGRPQVVTTHGRWWLPSGTPANGPKLPPLSTVAVGPGPVLLGAEERRPALWDLRSRKLIPTPPGLQRIQRMALDASGRRNLATVIDDSTQMTTFDLATGVPVAPPIVAHAGGLMLPQTRFLGSTEMALVGDVIAVSTRWRVHLWNAATSEPAGSPLTGPVGAAVLAMARWQGRDLLLTGSEDDGVVGLWDLDVPVHRAPGHGERIVAITRAEPAGVVVSVDEGGTIVARDESDGRLLHNPLATGVEPARGVAAWPDGAATVGGSEEARHPWLRRFDLTTGDRLDPDIDLRSRFVRHLLRADLDGTAVLVTLSQGPVLRVFRAADGLLLGETKIEARSGVSGFAVGSAAGRPAVVLSTWYHPMSVFTLDDLTAAPITIPGAGDDAVLAVDGPHIVARRHDEGEGEGVRPGHIVRVWDTAGHPVTPGIRRPAPVTQAAVRAWPTAYLAHADRTVTLTDLVTGQDAGEPLRLPLAPSSLAVTADGDLLAGAGSDVLRYHPPGVKLEKHPGRRPR